VIGVSAARASRLPSNHAGRFQQALAAKTVVDATFASA
jgi:hypothetical protein